MNLGASGPAEQRMAAAYWLLPLLVLLLGIFSILASPLPINALRNAGFDQFQRWLPRAATSASARPVTIVDIDEDSLRRLGQWPWPRSRLADLVDRLRAAGAAAIVFDVVFPESDRTSPQAMAELWPLPASLRAELADLPDHDALLAQAMAGGRVVLGFAADASGAHARVPAVKSRFVARGQSALGAVHPLAGSVPSLPIFEAAAAGNGTTAFFPDADGIVRRVPMLVAQDGQLLPSLVAEALRVAQDISNYVTVAGTDDGGLAGLQIGRLAVATTASGEVWVHYSLPSASRYLPAWQVLARSKEANGDGQTWTDRIAGKIVLIGSSAQGLMDLRFSPLGDIIAGVEVHAQVIEQLLANDSLQRPASALLAEAVFTLFAGVLLIVLTARARARWVFAALLVLLGLIWLLAWQAYVGHGVLLDAGNPTVLLLFVATVAGALRLLVSERRQRWVRQAFSRYVSPNLVNHLIAHPESLELSGHRQQCSFIFTDLSGFTALMERMDPGAAVAMLNDYLDRMIAIAFSYQGTLDRIVGDAVVIMFAAPVYQTDHPSRALACALAMQRFANAHRRQLQQQGVAFGHTRFGVHSGEVIVGNFGGRSIFDYRALGDTVNIASRLEGANKAFGTQLCVSGATLAHCPDAVARPIGQVIFVGKAQAVETFEVLDTDSEGEGGSGEIATRRLLAYRAAYALLVAGDAAALAAFSALHDEAPEDALVAFQLARVRDGNFSEILRLAAK